MWLKYSEFLDKFQQLDFRITNETLDMYNVNCGVKNGFNNRKSKMMMHLTELRQILC